MNNLKILIENPELAKDITLQVNGSDLLTFADKLVKDTAVEVETRLKEQNKPDELLSRQQVAKMLGVTLVTLFNWNNKGILPTIKIGSKVRYRRSDVEKALKEGKRGER